MEKTVIAAASSPAAVVAARDICIAKIADGAGGIASYARTLEVAFNIVDAKGKVLTPWWALKGKAKAPIKAENIAFKAGVDARGLAKGVGNTYWGRVKAASGYVTKGKASKAGETVDDKSLAELKTLINRAYKADEDGEDGAEKTLKAMGKLKEVYKSLGGNVDELG